MSIVELKSGIENNTLDLTNTQVWQLTDESSLIIAEQYIHKLAEVRELDIKYIDDFKAIPDTSFMEDNNLYILKTDEIDKIQQHDNCIILCKTTKYKEAIKLPKLEDWQVVDYACSLVKGLKKVELEWLITQYNGNYMKYLSDISKLSCINESQQSLVYEQMLNEGQFSDHTSLNIWDLTNGIIKKDLNVINEALKVIDVIDVEPLGLLTTLYKGFKHVIDIQLNPRATAESTGLNSKQFYVIQKYNCGHYTKEELIRIFKLLTSMEYKFKYESLDIADMIDYLIVNIVG